MYEIRDYLKPTFNLNIIKIALFLVGESSSRSFLFNSLKLAGVQNQKSLNFDHKKRALDRGGKEATINK